MTYDTTVSPLLEPARLGPHELANRLVIAPMTRNRAEPDGTPTPLMAEYYAQRATAGMIIAEASTPNAEGQTYPNITALYTDRHQEGWRRVVEAVRAAGGGPVFVQLQHGGRVGHPDTNGLTPVAPSPVALPEPIHTPGGLRPAVVPREMTAEDIARTVRDFASAARRAVDAGFAGVEVHSANGHLLHQFLASGTNRRTDGYGGGVAGRVRFAAEVVAAVVEAIGPERTGLRVSPGNTVNGITETDTDALYPALLAAVAGREPAYLHLAYADPDRPLFHRLRELWPGTLIANPVLPADHVPADGGRAAGERLLAAGADLVALGRPFLANPDLVARVRAGAPVNDIRARYAMYTGGPVGYTDYPTYRPASVSAAAGR
ncbi:alkene reductase [Streptomyces griseoviridis]|uniref:N-ethylmaleimide reductase n=1 Tax=Streptomyces griseoviridis TaxID=45398 RepID=A0ABT9LCX6_STRGD|nr:alkene reductase [Streptomyces griseoviridis]MDP9681579.1 N-ethylmaleimide reductase [Streptomyces griseoviridis]GGS73550.1 alkene reductase [Streptomyces griseoviridis]